MFKRAMIAIGEGFLHRITIFEFKKYFSIYLHVFNTIAQDRFHTHAFNGMAIILYGGYEEEYIARDKSIRTRKVGMGLRFIGRNYNHRILKSQKNTISILFAGPWAKTWTEENQDYVRTLTWGRVEVSRDVKN